MRILITSGASALARDLAEHLVPDYEVRLTDRSGSTAGVESGMAARFDLAVADLGHDSSTRLILQDRDALVLLHQQGRAGESAHQLIDMATRGVYNLLMAATEAGLRRVICVSSLELMTAYDADMTVSERWRPRPTTDPASLGAFLTEATCREFAREHKIDIVLLRAGRPVRDDAHLAEGGWDLRARDLAEGVNRALQAPARPWSVYHLQSDVADPRFTTQKAQQELGFLRV